MARRRSPWWYARRPPDLVAEAEAEAADGSAGPDGPVGLEDPAGPVDGVRVLFVMVSSVRRI